MNWRFHQLLKCSVGKLDRCVDLQSWIVWSKTLLPDDCSPRSMKLWVAINVFDQIIQLCNSTYIYIYIYIYFLNLNIINFGQHSTLRGAVTIMIYSSKISIHRFIAIQRWIEIYISVWICENVAKKNSSAFNNLTSQWNGKQLKVTSWG